MNTTPYPTKTINSLSGFSLVELAIIISIATTIIIGFMIWTTPKTMTDAEKIATTHKKLAHIEQAFIDFRVRNGRLPCPADPKKRSDNNRTAENEEDIDLYNNIFGTENIDIKEETVNGTLTFGVDCPEPIGALPVYSLGLDQDYMEDGWGNRFTYHISTSLCGNDTVTDISTPETNSSNSILSSITGCTSNDYTKKNGNITVKQADTIITNTAGYVIFSHGPNGKGAYSSTGIHHPVTANDTTITEAEKENLDHDDIYNKLSTEQNFDDVLYFKDKAQIERESIQYSGKLLTMEQCQKNALALSRMNKTHIKGLNETLTRYEQAHRNTGEEVALGLLFALQELCIRYYGANAIDNSPWKGAACPGNNQTENSITYNHETGICSCQDKTWDGHCTPDEENDSRFSVTEGLRIWLDASDPYADGSYPKPGSLPIWHNKAPEYPNSNAHARGYPLLMENTEHSIKKNWLVRFNGENSHYEFSDMDLNSLSSGEIFIVLKTQQTPPENNKDGLWKFGVNSPTLYPSSINNKISDTFGTTTRKENIPLPNIALTYLHLYHVWSKENQWLNSFNGLGQTVYQENESAFIANPTIGKSDENHFFHGMIGEVLLYDRDTAEDRLIITCYLADKWQLAIHYCNTIF